MHVAYVYRISRKLHIVEEATCWKWYLVNRRMKYSTGCGGLFHAAWLLSFLIMKCNKFKQTAVLWGEEEIEMRLFMDQIFPSHSLCAHSKWHWIIQTFLESKSLDSYWVTGVLMILKWFLFCEMKRGGKKDITYKQENALQMSLLSSQRSELDLYSSSLRGG